MELDVRLGKEALSITISDPFHLDMPSISGKIAAFMASHDDKLNGLDIAGLLPRMVKGIAGCEAGCPSDAMNVVRKGHQDFKLEYIEGGIMSATARSGKGQVLTLKLFPEF